MYSITIKILLSKSLFIKNAYGGVRGARKFPAEKLKTLS